MVVYPVAVVQDLHVADQGQDHVPHPPDHDRGLLQDVNVQLYHRSSCGASFGRACVNLNNT